MFIDKNAHNPKQKITQPTNENEDYSKIINVTSFRQ